MYDVASAIAASEPWLRRIMPRLEALRDQTQETAILGKEQGGRVIYLAVLEGPQNIRYTARPGDLKPLHSSSIGKTLLATMKPRVRADVLAKLPLDAMTDATITDHVRLAEEIERSAARGYSITRGENVADVMAVAMPVKFAGDTFGIAVAGPHAPHDGTGRRSSTPARGHLQTNSGGLVSELIATAFEDGVLHCHACRVPRSAMRSAMR